LKLSIIIPTLNESYQIGWLIQYLQNSLKDNKSEIIIADGGSTDSTRRIARNLNVRVIECNSTGRSLQMNSGAEIARGGVMLFLHADSFPPKDFYFKICKSVRSSADAGCFRLKFDDPHPLLWLYSWFTRYDIDLFRFGDQGLFIKKSMFHGINGFDESLAVMEDQDIVKKIRREGGQFIILSDQMITSARKYRTNGVFKLQAVFFLIVLFYYCGAAQDTLIHLYKSLVKL